MSVAARGTKYVVARAADLDDGSRMIVTLRGRSIGVFNVGGRYYALLNRCPHQGAELCRGLVSPLIQSDLPGDIRFDESRPMLQCPWHRWEFELETGQSYCDPRRLRVKPFSASVDSGASLIDAIGDEVESGSPLREETGHLGRGPYTAETFAVTVEDDYVVVRLP